MLVVFPSLLLPSPVVSPGVSYLIGFHLCGPARAADWFLRCGAGQSTSSTVVSNPALCLYELRRFVRANSVKNMRKVLLYH